MTQEQRPDENVAKPSADLPTEKEEIVGEKRAGEKGVGEEKVGWIEGLAQRSAGLPQTTRQAGKEPGKSPWSYAGVGLQFLATTALFLFMGMYVDRKMGWSPWATVGFTMIGLIGGMYLLIKDAIKNNADTPPAAGRKDAKDGK